MRLEKPPRADVLVVCDVGPAIGVGHVMRCLALSEEFRSRGLSVLFSADIESVAFAHEQVVARGIPWVAPVTSPAEHRALVEAVDPQVAVIDSYLLAPAVYDAVRGAAPRTLAFTDSADLGGRVADVFLDQNVGAELDHPELPPGSVRLAGLDYALIRDEILALRSPAPRMGGDSDPLRVLAFFGGTDAFGAAPVVLPLLVAAGRPFDATVIAATAQMRDALAAIEVGPGQYINTSQPTDRLAALAADADLVVSAAGTSTWELACLGVAAAFVRVADNQVVPYGRLLATGTAVGIGGLEPLRWGDPGATAEAVATLRRVLGAPSLRDELRQRAWSLVDGRGRVRVVDFLIGA